MNIKELKVKIRDYLSLNNYKNNFEEGGVFTHINSSKLKGKINIRPKFQREFVYNDSQKKAVINSIYNGFPLNIMYWSVNNSHNDIAYDVLDGQQRTISIGDFIHNDYAVTLDGVQYYFDSMDKTQQNKILDYELSIYICEGDDSEKMDWFKIINTAGEPLNEQEILNAVYSSPFISNMRKYFSKTNGAGDNLSKNLMKYVVNRQELLAAVLKAYVNFNKNLYDNVEMLLAEMKTLGDLDSELETKKLIQYFESVIKWVESLFGKTPNDAKKVNWFDLYNTYSKNKYDSKDWHTRIIQLYKDDEITKTSGIYEYLLSGDPKYLNIRQFEKKDIYRKINEQNYKCNICSKEILLENCHADHIKPWTNGGKTEYENLQILCISCNLKKSSQE